MEFSLFLFSSSNLPNRSSNSRWFSAITLTAVLNVDKIAVSSADGAGGGGGSVGGGGGGFCMIAITPSKINARRSVRRSPREMCSQMGENAPCCGILTCASACCCVWPSPSSKSSSSSSLSPSSSCAAFRAYGVSNSRSRSACHDDVSDANVGGRTDIR